VWKPAHSTPTSLHAGASTLVARLSGSRSGQESLGRGGLQWPRRGGLKWLHFASVCVCD
jgi:hypothetical protein